MTTRRQKADAVTSRLNTTAVSGRSGARLMRVIPQWEPGGKLYVRPGTCALLSDSLHNICPTGQNLGGGRITLASPLRILGGRVPLVPRCLRLCVWVMAKRCVIEQKLQLTAYWNSYRPYGKSIGTKMNDLNLCLEVVSRSCHCVTFDFKYLAHRYR